MTIAVVDFFSGCGGTSLGFRDAGMSILAGIDNDPEAAATYRENFPEAKFFERDIQSLDVEEIAKILPKKQPVLFSGCAPCQPFSKQNRSSGKKDPRRFLLAEFQRFILALSPDYVVVENVPGLQKVGRTGPFNSFVRALKKHGYDVTCQVLSALDYGVPQVRKRLVLVAAKNTVAMLPQPTHGPGGQKTPTFADWASQLPPLKAGEADENDPDHAAMG
ncbi:DNA cytosine methyltransferase, partial [Lentzea sp.]|uniref:DNA cytosine methyltransferase n=1 Tax=Lentzea sp. TaxID=56099 RepID=UPI002ED0743B